MSNQDSLLSRILGVFEVRVQNQNPLSFFITENMIGNDFQSVHKCYDLKGSLFHRITSLNQHEEEKGSGMKVLKDLNFKDGDNELQIDMVEKKGIMDIIEKDSKLLKKHKLIDYSVFLILVKRETKMTSNA